MSKDQKELRERIIAELQKLSQDGDAPSEKTFSEATGFTKYQIRGFWPKWSAAVEEAGLRPKTMFEAIPLQTLFLSLAELTRDLQKFPTKTELRLASINRGLPSLATFNNRLGGKREKARALAAWVKENPEFQDISEIVDAAIDGVDAVEPNDETVEETQSGFILSEIFVPPVVSCLPEMARGADFVMTACIERNLNINTEFERRIAIAFELLGLSVEKLGQGQGRNPDGIAKCKEHHWAIIYDAKVRSSGYRFLTDDDRKFKEYIEMKVESLRQEGITRSYFAVISSNFSAIDLPKAQEFNRTTNAKACVFVEADALVQLIDQRFRFSREFSMTDVERVFNDTNIVRADSIRNQKPRKR